MNSDVKLDIDRLVSFCQRWQIRELSVFGSALREDFHPGSDLDFLVSFDPDSTWDLFDWIEMKNELESQCGRAVDIVEKEALRNPWRKQEILSTREIVYGMS